MSVISYKIQTGTSGEAKVYEIFFCVPNFFSTKEKEFYAEPSENSCAELDLLRIRIKMQFLGRDNNVVEIYHMLPSTAYINVDLLCRGRYDYDIITTKKFHTAQCNKWYFLYTMHRPSLCKDKNDLKFKLNYTIISFKEDQPKVRLNDDLKCLLENGNYYEVTMKSLDGKEYKVHKAILASRSVVLKAHFEHNTVESQKNVVESPFDAEVLDELLTLIYSDMAPNIDRIPEKLLSAADYYQLKTLKDLCEIELHKKLTIENAIQTLQLAYLYSAENLKQLTLDFIKDGHVKHVIKTDGWIQMSSVEIMKSIIEHIINDDY